MNILNFILALLLSPLLPGIINKTKAFFAGRKGPSIFQLYYDLYKLARKGAIYSTTTSWIFRAAPVVNLSAILLLLLFIPSAGNRGLISFSGDLILFAYLFVMIRFFMIAAALDTGSSFEGMGASREASFAAMAEPSFFLCLATLASLTQNLSLSTIYKKIMTQYWINIDGPILILIVTVLLILFLVENCRIPIDDPNTHLELTMIHEVMILDYSSVDLSFIFYASALKMWIFAVLLVELLLPFKTGYFLLNELIFLAGLAILTVAIGIIESILARIRLIKVFELLVMALTIAIFAFLLQMG